MRRSQLGAVSCHFTVELSYASAPAAVCQLHHHRGKGKHDGTASAGSDYYQAKNGDAPFAPPPEQASINVIVSGDTDV
jgi:hypothetical protein